MVPSTMLQSTWPKAASGKQRLKQGTVCVALREQLFLYDHVTADASRGEARGDGGLEICAWSSKWNQHQRQDHAQRLCQGTETQVTFMFKLRSVMLCVPCTKHQPGEASGVLAVCQQCCLLSFSTRCMLYAARRHMRSTHSRIQGRSRLPADASHKIQTQADGCRAICVGQGEMLGRSLAPLAFM